MYLDKNQKNLVASFSELETCRVTNEKLSKFLLDYQLTISFPLATMGTMVIK